MRASRALVYATAAALPAYLVRFHVGPIPTTVLEVVLLATLVAFPIEAYVTGVRPRWPGAFTGPMVVLAVAVVISVLVAPDRRDAVGIARAFFVEPALYFAVACTVIATPREMGRLAMALFTSGAIVAVAQLVAFADAAAHHQRDLVTSPPVAWFSSPNFPALLLGPLIGLALAMVLWLPGRRWRVSRVGALLFLAVAVPAGILTLSRGLWLALVAMAVFLAAVHPRRRLLLGGVVVLCAVALALGPVRARLAHELNASDQTNSVVTRSHLWHDTLVILRHKPVTGLGLAPPGQPQLPVDPLAGPGERTNYPHDIVLDFWLELGLLGLLGFVWFVVRVARWLAATARAGGAETMPFVVGSAAAWVAILVHGSIDNPIFKNDLGTMTLAICALVATAARIERVRLRALVRLPGTAADIEPAELPMPADIPRRTGRFPSAPASSTGADGRTGFPEDGAAGDTTPPAATAG